MQIDHINKTLVTVEKVVCQIGRIAEHCLVLSVNLAVSHQNQFANQAKFDTLNATKIRVFNTVEKTSLLQKKRFISEKYRILKVHNDTG